MRSVASLIQLRVTNCTLLGIENNDFHPTFSAS